MPTRKPGDAEKIIQQGEGGIICTGDGVKIFQLLAVKHALKLEEKGMAFKGKRKIRSMWAEALSLPKRATYKQVIEAIEAEIKKLEVANGMA